MTGEKEVLGDETRPIEEIAERIGQPDQTRGRVQRNERNGQKPAKREGDPGPDKGHENAGTVDGPDDCQQREAPDHNEQRDGNIKPRQFPKDEVVKYDSMSVLNPLKVKRENGKNSQDHNDTGEQQASKGRGGPGFL